MEIESLAEKLRSCVNDTRRPWGNKRHKLEDILVIGFCTIICGGEDFVDMEDFGIERREWLCGFLELPNGIPDSDTFRRVFERVEPRELADVLRDWLDLYRAERDVVSIDGKTIRGSASARHKACHVVSAFVAQNRITLGEIKVAEKSNEITAIPELLDLLDLEGSIVTIDAMGCQTRITEKITEKHADYVIGLKANQPALHDDAALYFDTFADKCARMQTLDKGHGRVEERDYFLAVEPDWLSQKADWSSLNSLGAVRATIEENGLTRTDTRYFITSLTNIDDFAQAVREHWSIENQLHWSLDVIFREDAGRARKDNSPMNLNILRKTALPLLKAADFGRIGLRKKMFRAALSLSSLKYVLTGKK